MGRDKSQHFLPGVGRSLSKFGRKAIKETVRGFGIGNDGMSQPGLSQLLLKAFYRTVRNTFICSRKETKDRIRNFFGLIEHRTPTPHIPGDHRVKADQPPKPKSCVRPAYKRKAPAHTKPNRED